MKIGYFLSCEEWAPHELLTQAVKAQSAGFEGLWISDHQAGFDELYVNQIGPGQDAFFNAYRDHVLPAVR
jgi:alkanesulfonate monooxygenase SsuD/methylene tetrahydromethanopterin reductase-like flavin-dependent oxidoreductase (luciferase family)